MKRRCLSGESLLSDVLTILEDSPEYTKACAIISGGTSEQRVIDGLQLETQSWDLQKALNSVREMIT
jgi:hypothetical protein